MRLPRKTLAAHMGYKPHIYTIPILYDGLVADRFHLGSISEDSGTIWFTLVVDSPSNFFVERYNDSTQPFIRDRLKTIKPSEFGKHQINGVSLNKIVGSKLVEIGILLKQR